MPSEDDLESDEGFGFFRDVWLIVDISKSEARKILDDDGSLLKVVSNLATSEIEFDDIATALETGSVEGIEGLSSEQLSAMAPYLEGIGKLEGLEIGVAGLVYCLAAAGMYPAASCRGHEGSNAWSKHPVVLVASDRNHAVALEPLVSAAGCGFNLDTARPELIAIESRSVADTLNLATAVFDNMVESSDGD